MKALLELVRERPVAAFNFNGADELSAILKAAVDSHEPVICMISERAAGLAGVAWLLELFHAGKRHYGADCFVQLDHWAPSRTDRLRTILPLVNGILLDYSKEPAPPHPNEMAQAVRLFQSAGVWVELEWEHIPMGGEALYSIPEEAVDRHRLVPFDLWAPRLGTVHGLEAKPEIDFERMAEVVSGAPVPVAAHGCDLLDRPTLRMLSRAGVRKFNFGPELRRECSRVLSLRLDPDDYRFALAAGRAAVEDLVRTRLQDIQPIGEK